MTVALNGDGGDESFAGYLRYVANSLSGGLDRVPRGLRRGGAALAERLLALGDARGMRSYGRRFLTSIGEDAPGRYASHVCIFSPAERAALLGERAAPGAAGQTAEVIAGPWRAASGRSRLDVLLETDIDTYLPGDLLTKMDIASMAYSLEARSPLLDPELMQFAASLPAPYKARLHGEEVDPAARLPRAACRTRSWTAASAASACRSAPGSAASCAISRATSCSTPRRSAGGLFEEAPARGAARPARRRRRRPLDADLVAADAGAVAARARRRRAGRRLAGGLAKRSAQLDVSVAAGAGAQSGDSSSATTTAPAQIASSEPASA